MILEDFHMHTHFCDGKNSPEEMVQGAIRAGMKRMGFSGHAPYPQGTQGYAIAANRLSEYRAEINRLKGVYKDQITIFCGIEQDLLSIPAEGFDYVIGSVHNVCPKGSFHAVDLSPEEFETTIAEGYDGDAYALCEDYYENVGKICETLNPDIIGHVDLVTKFNEKGHYFDENHPRYVAAWKKALDKLLPYNVPFEINSGAISRGWRTEPYPAKPILQYLFKHGGRVVINSDSHAADTVGFRFAQSEQIAREVGFTDFSVGF